MQHNLKKGETLRSFYDLVRNRQLQSAQSLIEELLGLDTTGEVITAFKCLSFWRDREDTAQTLPSTILQGEFYTSQWAVFEEFTENMENYSEHCHFAFRHYAFSQAISYFTSLHEESESYDPELPMKIAYCYRCMGEYELAINFYKRCFESHKEQASFYAELADTYALVGKIDYAKVLFREALFIDPLQIDFSRLESELFHKLFEKVKLLGLTDKEAKEWLLTYGIIWRVLNVKRELRPIEQGKIRQKIHQLERDFREKEEEQAVILPRLLNQYFRVLEQYTGAAERQDVAKEYLLKIRSIAPEIYKLYVQ